MKYLFGIFLSFSFLPPATAQLFAPVLYPKDYFRDPLDVPMSLAANFGELRPNHYHMGLDIRTQHRVNLPVYAAADGYVARIEIEPEGFGQAIYIRHPNGYTTVYGHLNQFFPALAAYIHEQQYRQQSWQVDLSLPPNLFPVKKGQFIAFSGSTGGSQGPHLHFEIRQTAGDINLNPLLFGLPVPDATSPTILQLAWYDRTTGIYDQSPHLLPVKKNAADWSITPALLIVPTPRISFALSAFDTQSGSNNPNGIYEADLSMDDTAFIGFRMNYISYDNTRNINAHIDYKTRETGGPFLQQLFFLQGYPAPSIYRVHSGSGPGIDPAGKAHAVDGVLHLEDGRIHPVMISVHDTYGNLSVLRFSVQYQPNAINPPAAVFPGVAREPVSFDTSAAKTFYPGMIDGLELPDAAFYLAEKSLYDSARLRISKIDWSRSGWLSPHHDGMSDVYRIGEPWIPLLEPVLVRMEPTRAMPVDSLPGQGYVPLTDKVVMVCTGDDGQRDVQRPQWQGFWASARFREFGNFQLVQDTLAPVISFPGLPAGANYSKAARIVVSVKDNLGPIRDFSAELDPPADGGSGQWLCFTNDKHLAFIYTFDEHCPPGRHMLRITAHDVAGNAAVRTISFLR